MTSSSLTEALGWTLLHSLWQTTLVALVFYLIVQLTRRPTYIYWGGIAALLIVTSWSLFTFVDVYQSGESSLSSPATSITPVSPAAELPPTIEKSATFTPLLALPWTSHLMAWVAPYLELITLGWLVGMTILAVRLLGGLWYLSRLKHHLVTPLPAWDAPLTTLINRLGLRRRVTVQASGVVKVPMVVGYLKPVILFPVALASNLPQAHIEAILAHELAHVHRHDYWVNVLQSLVEVLFFYHPAVWWLSSVVREEREKCCDDLAVALCGDILVYAQALSRVESVRQATPSLALALAQRRGGLLARIERLVQPSFSSSSPVIKLLSVVAALLLVIYLAGGDTLARMARGVSRLEPQRLATASPPMLIPVASDTIKPTEAEEEDAWQGSDKARTLAPPANSGSLPDNTAARGKEKRRSGFSFQVDDSTNVFFDMDLNVDQGINESDDSHVSFHFSDGDTSDQNHLKIHVGDSFPSFTWNDSSWLESIGALGNHMSAFSEELAGFLTDSIATDELQAQLGNVQRELDQLKAELGSSLSEERMEALERKLEAERQRVQQEMERIQHSMKQRQERASEQQQRARERQAEVQARERIRQPRSFDDTVDQLEQALLADGLIEKGKEYRFELKPRGLYINRKKQDDDLTKKYRDLLEVTENTNFSITRVAEQ